jgi:hypothetical protein
MEKYIKYKRFTRELNGDEGIQIFLDEISSGGWDIISYNEMIKDTKTMIITIIAGKKQNSVL